MATAVAWNGESWGGSLAPPPDGMSSVESLNPMLKAKVATAVILACLGTLAISNVKEDLP